VFAQKLIVEIISGRDRRLCPRDWLDSFCMRNFTGSPEFDDTLPLDDGLLEAGFRVIPDRLAQAMSEWFTRRGKGGGQPVHVEVSRQSTPDRSAKPDRDPLEPPSNP
jgi:hypothetical protein